MMKLALGFSEITAAEPVLFFCLRTTPFPFPVAEPFPASDANAPLGWEQKDEGPSPFRYASPPGTKAEGGGGGGSGGVVGSLKLTLTGLVFFLLLGEEWFDPPKIGELEHECVPRTPFV